MLIQGSWAAKKYGKPIHLVSSKPTKEELNSADGIIVVAVSAWGAREKIRAALLHLGKLERQDFILAAKTRARKPL